MSDKLDAGFKRLLGFVVYSGVQFVSCSVCLLLSNIDGVNTFIKSIPYFWIVLFVIPAIVVSIPVYKRVAKIVANKLQGEYDGDG